MKSRRFAVLDRDGTIIAEKEYLSDYRQVELLPAAAEGMRLMRQAGLGLVVVTNQSGLGRGYFTRRQMDQVNERMLSFLSDQGVEVDGIFFCPHTPQDDCRCRKPRPGMVEQAADRLGFEPADCFVVGDSICDVELGRGIGAATFLVRTGYGAALEAGGGVWADHVVDDLLDAAREIRRICSEQGAERISAYDN